MPIHDENGVELKVKGRSVKISESGRCSKANAGQRMTIEELQRLFPMVSSIFPAAMNLIAPKTQIFDVGLHGIE